MVNKYDQIQQLIGFWQEFEKSTIRPDLSKFGDWLKNHFRKESNLLNIEKVEARYSDEEYIIEEIAAVPIKHQIISLFSRLARMQDFYAKKFFDGLPINSLLEFNFLFSINKNISLKKKEIIGLHLVEYSTGIDILKRLIKLQLVMESRDELDKRSKRLKVTSEGKKVLIEALIRMNKINDLFFIEFSDQDLEPLLPILNLLDNHHNKLFSSSGSNSSFNLLQILESIDKIK